MGQREADEMLIRHLEEEAKVKEDEAKRLESFGNEKDKELANILREYVAFTRETVKKLKALREET